MQFVCKQAMIDAAKKETIGTARVIFIIRKEALTGFAEGIDRSAVSRSAPIALMVGRFKVVRNMLGKNEIFQGNATTDL